MACLAVPLVVSVHSVVGLDFAASLMPGWQETIFPPYFVVGAMYSGFAMVVVPRRCWCAGAFGMQALITVAHFDAMAKIMLAGLDHHGAVLRDRMVHGLVRRRARRAQPGRLRVHRRLCAAVLGAAALQRASVPQALWLAAVRRNIAAVFAIAVAHQYRHVARAHPDRLEHAVARLPAEHVAAVPPDHLGLAHHARLARPLRAPVPDLRAPAAGRVDARGAQARRRGGAS